MSLANLGHPSIPLLYQRVEEKRFPKRAFLASILEYMRLEYTASVRKQMFEFLHVLHCELLAPREERTPRHPTMLWGRVGQS